MEALIWMIVYSLWILMWFEAMFGLKVNLQKSELITAGEVDNEDKLASLEGCKREVLPTTYLGLPLGEKYKASVAWDNEKKKIRRLVMWKMSYIYIYGPLCSLNFIFDYPSLNYRL